MKKAILIIFGLMTCACAYSADYSIFKAPELINLKAKSLDVIDVLQDLSEKGKFNISVSAEVSGKVTVFISQVTVEEALNIVLKSADLAVLKEKDMIYIMTKTEYKKRTGDEYMYDRKMSVMPLQNVSVQTAEEVVNRFKSSDAQIMSETQTNTLVMIDNSAKIEEMQAMVDKMDTAVSINAVEATEYPLSKTEYYLHVAERIKAYIPRWYFKGNDIIVKVRFTLSQYGELLGEPEVLTFELEQYWKDLAISVIKNSVPFAPFSKDMRNKEELFEIDLAL